MTGARAVPDFGWRPGLRVGAGLGLAVFPVAISFGALATTLGWHPVATIICSTVVFSAGAQLALLTTLSAGSALPVALAAATLINLRFLAMGVAVAGSLTGPRWKRALAGQTILDGSWAAGLTAALVLVAPAGIAVLFSSVAALVVLIGRRRPERAGPGADEVR